MRETDAEEGEETGGREKAELPARAGQPDEPTRVAGADHLEEVVGNHHVILASFFVDWCGRCKLLEPTVQTLGAERAAAVAIGDVDADQGAAPEYGVQRIPTLYLLVDGEPTERLVVVRKESELRSPVETHA